MASYEIDAKAVDELMKLIDGYQNRARDAINDVFHGEGAKMLKDSITDLLPVSGRRFKGHKAGAKESQPFTQDDKNLQVDIVARGKWGYLVFPDEGRGEHNPTELAFMKRGADAATDDIIELVAQKLIDNF